MNGIAKKVIMIAVGLLVVFALLVAVIPQIQTSITALEALDPAAPAIMLTLANLWWIPMILIMVALIMGATKTGRRQIGRVFRRRR
ncbi:hypothetical protein ES703_79670 [subsurface metagenome]